MNPTPTKLRRRVIYTGHVQGVGFRYTTYNVAAGHVVVGFVRNMPDGTVELEAEGDLGAVEAFLMGVQRHLGRYIQNTTITDIALLEAESAFIIQH
ncbi:MAG: acylphosphatase [Phycisphaerae bacterium]|nr:acylphosphatase [Phycisphaerae bacterium]